jgi:hypothetical protein
MSALSAVQAAVYTVLAGDATLLTLAPGGVWDHVPQNPTWPYVRVGGMAEDPMDTAGMQGRLVTFVVHAWSQYRGVKEAYAIVDRVVALLRYAPLSLGSDWTHCDTKHMTSQADEPTLSEGGEQIQHVWAEFEVGVQEVL